MPASTRLAERAAAVGLFAAVGFNAPVIDTATGTVAGVPALLLYVFGVWAAVVAALALAMARDRPPGPGA
jgi:hypothetical protein